MRKQIRGWSIVEEDDPVNVERLNAVRDAMIHAWTCYEKYAWGHDELQVCMSNAMHHHCVVAL